MHGIRDCKSKAKCYKCRSVRHHTAICNTGETLVSNTRQYMDINREKTSPDNKVTLITSNKHAVLFQTIRVSATNIGETEKVGLNVIFDGGSQRTYLSKKLVQMLSLKPMDEQEMRISAFGEADGKLVKVNQYCFVLKGKNEDGFYLRGFDVPVICAPLSNQHLDAVKSKFELVKQLVPQNKEINGEIDVLIGADFSWSLMTDDIIRLDDRLVAIRSKLGYMLSGFIVDDEKVNNSSNCVHVLNVDVNNNNLMSMEENIILNEKVENFWNLDTLGIVNNEKSVYDINEKKIKVVDRRYEVSLPFKNYHPIIGDNYSHCVKRLKSMKGKLNKSPLLLKRYNDIIMSQCRDGIVE